MRSGLAIEAPEPCLLPEDQTSSLTPIMGRSITAVVLQVDGARHLPTADAYGRITGLVGPFANSHCNSAILKHLRHEGQLIEPAVGVQSRENLLLRSYLHPLTGTESERGRKCFIHGGISFRTIVGILRWREFGSGSMPSVLEAPKAAARRSGAV